MATAGGPLACVGCVGVRSLDCAVVVVLQGKFYLCCHVRVVVSEGEEVGMETRCQAEHGRLRNSYGTRLLHHYDVHIQSQLPRPTATQLGRNHARLIDCHLSSKCSLK